MVTDKNLKNRTILAYVHNMLIDAEDQKNQGKGKIIIEDETKRDYSLEQGFKFIKYCKLNGCTVDSLEKLSFVNINMLKRAKKYYGKSVDIYSDAFENRHIPLLFATIVFEKLEQQGYLELDVDYKKLFDTIKESNHLEREKRLSKYSNKEIVVDAEVNTYNKCVDELFTKVYAVKPNMKRKRK